jgi:hypothetical protein
LYNIFSTHDYYTTGSTLTNKILSFNRIDSIGAYSVNLSAFTYQSDFN